jgi:hypothetical protein
VPGRHPRLARTGGEPGEPEPDAKVISAQARQIAAASERPGHIPAGPRTPAASATDWIRASLRPRL